MIQYTLVFLFDQKLDRIALITKTHPDWQKGRLNAIGGVVEGDEDFYAAAEREVKEECGVDTHVHHFLSYHGKKFEPYVMYVFWALANFNITPPETKTEESIRVIKLDQLSPVTEKLYENKFVPGVLSFMRLALQAARNGDRS